MGYLIKKRNVSFITDNNSFKELRLIFKRNRRLKIHKNKKIIKLLNYINSESRNCVICIININVAFV